MAEGRGRERKAKRRELFLGGATQPPPHLENKREERSGRPQGLGSAALPPSSFILLSVPSIPPSLPPPAFMLSLIIAPTRLPPSLRLSDSLSPAGAGLHPRGSAWTGPREATGRRRSIPDGQMRLG